MALQQIPFKTDCTSNTITIEWQGQRGQFNNCIVKYKAKDSKDVFAVERTSECKIQMSNLKNKTLYEVKIFWEDNNGDESFLIKTEVKTLASIASTLLKSASKICDDPVIYRLTPVKVTNLTEGIQIREFFADVNNREERSLLLLGASGSGKSTLVDAFINYVADVSYAENFRFKITENEGNGTSITQGREDIVWYKIRCQGGFKVGFNLNIIDVPGFKTGHNESLYQKILALFQSVRCIGAACLVVPSLCRLTQDDRCTFNNILSIFGKDFNYIIPVITFDDGGETNALSSLKAAKVPFVEHMHFRFNNSQLLSGKEHVEIWNRRQKTMQNLFGEPTVFINCPLLKTIEVLKSRNMINQLFKDAKSLIKQIEQKEIIIKDYTMRKKRQQPIQRIAETNSHDRTICINCKMCKKACVINCSVSVRFFWYFVILLENFWSLVCCICPSYRCCPRCSRCRCVCKLPHCCCIKFLQRCLGCQCACSFAHHVKEYGRYRTNERDILKTVQIIEDQTDYDNQHNQETLQMEKRQLMTKLNMIYDTMLRHAECITTIALHNEPPIAKEVENIGKCIESLRKQCSG